MCSSAYEVILFTAAFWLAFFGAFRVGELVSLSKQVAGGFMVQEVGASEDRVVLWLWKSKTNQRGNGMRVMLFAMDGSGVCPVKGVKALMVV